MSQGINQGITFLQPQVALVLPLIAIALIAWRMLWRRRYVAFSTVTLFAGLRHRPSIVRRLPAALLLVAIGWMVAALAEPVIPHSEAVIQSQGLDIVLCLDLSSSMQEIMDDGRLARSAASLTLRQPPVNGPRRLVGKTRLDTTKEALKKFVSLRRDDRLGLVVFSDHAYVISPLTFDHEYLSSYIDMVDDQILRGEGMTAIGDGIGLGNYVLTRMSTTNVKNRVIIVFTDGEYNFGRDPMEALVDSEEAGIRVHVVGVAIEKEIRSKPAVQNLIRTIRQHGGKYFDANTASQLNTASTELDRIEKGTLTHKMHERNVPIYQWFLFPAILFLVGALALRAIPFFADFT